MQFKTGPDRPAFLVMIYSGGTYYIQLNVKDDAGVKTKTGWIELTDEVHTIEVDWAAATSDGANDGYTEVYIDDVLQEAVTGLDNDTWVVESFRMGFTSRLVGKSISGIFYIDDVATSNNGHIGVP
jgi:hypothetical protein